MCTLQHETNLCLQEYYACLLSIGFIYLNPILRISFLSKSFLYLLATVPLQACHKRLKTVVNAARAGNQSLPTCI